MKFLSVVADRDIRRKFEGALPTTIYQDDNDKNKNNNSEVYAQNPDIYSTALIISTSSWIFGVLLMEGVSQKLSSSSANSSSTNVEATLYPDIEDPYRQQDLLYLYQQKTKSYKNVKFDFICNLPYIDFSMLCRIRVPK
jgi:hypothetical protein